MIIVIFFCFFVQLAFSAGKKISIKEKTGTVTFEATNIPWGYTAGHDAFGELEDHQVRKTYYVLDDTNTPHLHENHAYVMATIKNSSLFSELKFDEIKKHLWNKKPIFLVMLCNCERDMDWGLDLLEEMIGERKKEVNFLYALPETIDKYNLVTTFDVHRLPTVIMDNIPMGFNNEKFRIPHDISSYAFRDREYAADQFFRFFQDFWDQSLPLVVRSHDPHPLPWSEPGKTWDLVGSNFKSLVIDDEDHDYLMMVYSPNCPACKAILPIFQDLAESLSNFPEIRVATFDKANNDFPVRGLYLKVYPTIYFFPARHKHESVNFFDFHTFHFTEEGLLGFVQRHADNAIDYKKVLNVIKNKPEKRYDGDCVVLDDKNFNQVVMDSEKDVFVDFHAPWCAYCKILAPTWEEICTFYNNPERWDELHPSEETKEEEEQEAQQINRNIRFDPNQRIPEQRMKRYMEEKMRRVMNEEEEEQIVEEIVEEETEEEGRRDIIVPPEYFEEGKQSIVIAKMDCSKNERFSARLGIRSYPTMLFYLKDDKPHPRAFRSSRTFQTLKNFVENHRSKSLKVSYGGNGEAVSEDQPCILINGNQRIDLGRAGRTGSDEDDYHVKSETGEYDFFLNICQHTKRTCATKSNEHFAVIQIGVSDPSQHCYNLGRTGQGNMRTWVEEFGNKPVSIIEYRNGERSDNFRNRMTRIRNICVETEEEEDFSFLYEDQSDPGAIIYVFELKSTKVCNV